VRSRWRLPLSQPAWRLPGWVRGPVLGRLRGWAEAQRWRAKQRQRAAQKAREREREAQQRRRP
jgi:hypothetical protein